MLQASRADLSATLTLYALEIFLLDASVILWFPTMACIELRSVSKAMGSRLIPSRALTVCVLYREETRFGNRPR